MCGRGVRGLKVRYSSYESRKCVANMQTTSTDMQNTQYRARTKQTACKSTGAPCASSSPPRPPAGAGHGRREEAPATARTVALREIRRYQKSTSP